MWANKAQSSQSSPGESLIFLWGFLLNMQKTRIDTVILACNMLQVSMLQNVVPGGISIDSTQRRWSPRNKNGWLKLAESCRLNMRFQVFDIIWPSRHLHSIDVRDMGWFVSLKLDNCEMHQNATFHQNQCKNARIMSRFCLVFFLDHIEELLFQVCDSRSRHVMEFQQVCIFEWIWFMKVVGRFSTGQKAGLVAFVWF